MSPEELYRVYERLAKQAARTPAPVDLEAIWQTLRDSAYLRALGCH